jgi:hypothetical protein
MTWTIVGNKNSTWHQHHAEIITRQHASTKSFYSYTNILKALAYSWQTNCFLIKQWIYLKVSHDCMYAGVNFICGGKLWTPSTVSIHVATACYHSNFSIEHQPSGYLMTILLSLVIFLKLCYIQKLTESKIRTVWLFQDAQDKIFFQKLHVSNVMYLPKKHIPASFWANVFAVKIHFFKQSRKVAIA